METKTKKNFNSEKLRDIQLSFEESIKLLERYIAERVSYDKEIKLMKTDLEEANKKLNATFDLLDDFKKKFKLEKVDNKIE